MSDYANVRASKLKLKLPPSSNSKKKSKKRKAPSAHSSHQSSAAEDNDAVTHDGWWAVSKHAEIRGAVAIELAEHRYIRALDNGLFILGPRHNEGDAPDPEEILTAMPATGGSGGCEERVAFKSGYGKYLGVDGQCRMLGRADAIGAHEQWQAVFQDGKTALMGGNGCFVSATLACSDAAACDGDADRIMVRSDTAGPDEMLRIRSNAERECDRPAKHDDDGNLNKVELSYIKQFQKFQDKRIRVHTGGAQDLKMAREQGRLHEKLLDRRSLMKADRYCK